MIHSLHLRGTYKDIPYDKKGVWAREILDNCYVFDIASGGRFIASRSLDSQRNLGKSIYDIMSREGAEEMLAHIMSHTDVIMFVKTCCGPAIVVPSLVPSCSLGVLVFAVWNTDDVFRAARAGRMKAVFSRELVAGKSIRHTKSSIKNQDRSALLLSRVAEAFEGTHADQLVSGDITSRLEERIYALSYYVGCPVGIVCDEPVIAVGDFDFSLFVAFTMISLMCAREIAPLREASIVLENNDYGVSVRVSMVIKGHVKTKIKGIEDFRALADRKRMLFEYMWNPDVIHIRFSPIAKDWSFLEVKSPKDEIEQ